MECYNYLPIAWFENKKEHELSHHRHLKTISHNLAKFVTKGFVSRTKDYVIRIELAYKKIFVYFSCEKSCVEV
jgi:hypothetical protein